MRRCSRLPGLCCAGLCCDWHTIYCGRGLSQLSALLSSQPEHIDFVEFFFSHTLSVKINPEKLGLLSQRGRLFLSIGRCHQYFNGDLCV